MFMSSAVVPAAPTATTRPMPSKTDLRCQNGIVCGSVMAEFLVSSGSVLVGYILGATHRSVAFVGAHRAAESAAYAVPDGCVAVRAGDLALARACRQGVLMELGVAAAAVFLQDLSSARRDFDGLSKALQCEQLAVAPAVFCLGQVLGHEVVGQVALDANGGRVVAGLLPAVVLALHDVTVGAGLGIRLEVREAVGVAERECAQAADGAQSHRKQEQRPRSACAAFVVHSQPSPSAADGRADLASKQGASRVRGATLPSMPRATLAAPPAR